MKANREAVWDVPVRLMHWGLVAAVAVAWFSGEETLDRHEWAGYAALSIVASRLVWGRIGSPRARFSDFMRSPRAVIAYAAALRRHAEPRYIGHNPLGGWMVAALLFNLILVGVSGWMYTLDAFWGLAWLEWSHRILAWSLIVLIALHVAGVAFSSWRHRENLVASMINGRKRRS
jgi:cytochrome b